MKKGTIFVFWCLVIILFILVCTDAPFASCSDDSEIYSNTFPYKEVCSECIGERISYRSGYRICSEDTWVPSKIVDGIEKGLFWADQWSFAQCNCTSYVAWKLNEAFADAGFPTPRFYNGYLQTEGNSWHNANEWEDAAERAGIEVDEYPMQGDVAWWAAASSNGYYGHVAFVEKINRDENSIEISEYNVEISKGYGVRTLNSEDDDYPDRFIHVLPLHVLCSEMSSACGPPFSTLEDYLEVPGTPDEDLPPYYCPRCDSLEPGGEGGCYDSEGDFYPVAIAQTPMEGPIGTSCQQWGTGFTPNSWGKFYFQMVEGGTFDYFDQEMDKDGHFDIAYVFNKPPGQYKWYVEDKTGEKSNEVTYTITGSTTSSTPTAYPSSGTWTSSPKYISVSCGSADRIYCTVRTAYGSIPEDPPIPTLESHDIFDETGTEYIGSSGSFKIWGESEKLKYIKVRFRGHNDSGYGPTSGVYLYAIDLRSNDPGDIGTTDGPDGNVKKVEIDDTGNNWHHSYSAYPGQSLETRVTVTNKGDETIDYFEVTIYRSNDKNFNKDEDYKYGREEEESDLDPGEKDHKHRTIAAPSTPGTYYVFAYVNRVDGKNGGEDQDWSNNYSRNDDVEEYAKLTVYPWPPPDWSIVKEESGSEVYIFYNNKKWWATSWEILSALGFKSEDLITYPDGKLGEFSSGPNVLSDGVFGELNSCIYLFESGQWHYLADWSYMDCIGGQHPENVIPITHSLFNMYAGGADVVPCISDEELEALIALYDSTNGSGWKNNTGWNTDSYPDSWYGVTVEKGKITGLNLENNGLSGEIPFEIGNLKNLESLSLFYNEIAGNIPSEIGNLKNLKKLILGANELTGSIPSEIWNLDNLTSLDLSSNGGAVLTGNIPAAIGNLVNLEYLNLSWNQLDGDIPLEIWQLVGLKDLDLQFCNLSGTIPQEICNLVNLESIDLWANQFSGPIPTEIWSLVNLRHLILGYNNFTGEIPPDIGNLVSLESLDLPANQFNGPIPSEIWSLVNLKSLSLRYNNFDGEEIPKEIGNLVKLEDLYLWDNVKGPIPPEIGNLVNLKSLDAQNSFLSGPLPPEIGNLVNLWWLCLNGNQLSGKIPRELGNIVNLIYLFIERNQMEGPIPTELRNLNKLRSLGVSGNSFVSVPTGLSQTISEIRASGNNLTFESLEPYVDYPNLTSFSYSPQAKVPVASNSLGLKQGNALNLTVAVGGSHNQYQWFKDGTAVSQISNDHSYSQATVAASDSGTYVCHVTNTLVTDLTLYTEDITVTVRPGDVDTDGDGLLDAVEDSWCTNPNDADTDDDGILDGTEDINQNGCQDNGETHPCKIDTDGDGIQDGTESGVTLADVGNDTNTSEFQPDTDPNSTTNPLISDTDDDGIRDGAEDINRNGARDPGETNPCSMDSDADGLADGQEDANRNGRIDPGETDPNDNDSDHDGYVDGDEVVAKTNPLSGASSPLIICTDNIGVCQACDQVIAHCEKRIGSAIEYAQWNAPEGTVALIKVGSGAYMEGTYTVGESTLLIFQNGSVHLGPGLETDHFAPKGHNPTALSEPHRRGGHVGK